MTWERLELGSWWHTTIHFFHVKIKIMTYFQFLHTFLSERILCQEFCARYNSLHPQGTVPLTMSVWHPLSVCVCAWHALNLHHVSSSRGMAGLDRQARLKKKKREKWAGTSPVQTYWHLPQQWNIQQQIVATLGVGYITPDNKRKSNDP